MTVTDAAGKTEPEAAEPAPVRAADLIRQRRGRNRALLAALLGFAVLVYVLALVKLGGG